MFKLNTYERALGFQLRNDEHVPANQAMFDMLLEAFRNDWTVTVDAVLPEASEFDVDHPE